MPRHAIPDVPAFERNHDAGSMAMLALETALRTQGDNRPAWWLAGMSGDAFKFVYDPGAVFEPLRDRVPHDVLMQACRAAGWVGHWHLGASMVQAIALVREAVRQDHPVITPFLGTRWYHGMVLIVGLDETTGEFLLQIARNDPSAVTSYETVVIPQHWDGPVPTGATWADNPLFILEGRASIPGETKSIEEALALAASLHAGPSLPYSDHPGAQIYSDPPLAGRFALQGAAALRSLGSDVADGEFVAFDIIWRIDAQLGQLHYDRSNAACFLREVAQKHPATRLLLEAAELYATTAETAKQLQHAWWDKHTSRSANQQAVRAAIEGSTSLVYALGGLPPAELASFRHTVPVLETPWGPAAIADSTRRRRGLLDLVDRLIEQEDRCAALLKHALK